MTPDTAQEEERYSTLRERALDFVLAKGGRVPEDVLIGYVFGNSGTPALWRPLLRDVLGKDDRLVFHASGEWSIPARLTVRDADARLLEEFVALDVETTGLKPSRQRVIEIAAVRYRDGQVERSYETLLNPGRPIPDFISKLTTITSEHVRDAPAFADVAAEVMEFIGDSLIIGHNVAFDINFLNAEFDRVNMPSLVNERLDTMGLAVKLLRSLRKPSLDRVATAVGLQPRRIHRAGDDARLTAEVAMRLVAQAMDIGVRDIDQLKWTAAITAPRPRDDVGRARSLLDRNLAHAMPKKPGVYLMKDARGEIIYVGKAKNLRDRVSSYYSQPIGYTRKMDGLIEAVAAIDHIVVGCELEALLLESQLIRRYMPRYNTALKKSEHYPYIKVDLTNPWPRVMAARRWKDDGARYYGPYRNATSARKTVDVINSVLPLRTCTRTFKSARSYGKPCIALDLHQCLGPCTGLVDADEYRQVIQDVLHFLDGKDDALHKRLLGELENAAERLDFEKAERIRKNIRSVSTILDEQARLRDAEHLHNLLLVLPSCGPGQREVMVILRGQRWAQLRAIRVPQLESGEIPTGGDDEDWLVSSRPVDSGGGDPLLDLADRIGAALERSRAATFHRPDHHAVDEANILNRWLFRNAGHPALVPIPLSDDGMPAVDSLALARQVLCLNDERLASLDIRRVGTGEEEWATECEAAGPAQDADDEAGSLTEVM